MRLLIRAMTIVATVLAGSLALSVHAAPIFLAGDSNIFTNNEDNEVFFQNVFNGKSVANYGNNSLSILGTTASETHYGSSTTITSAGLSSNDFMIFGFNRTSITTSELTAITNFYNGGGSLFLYGEGNTVFSDLNNAVNDILSAVGSTMSLSTTENFDAGSFTTLTNFVGTGPYAAGVNSWTTAYTSKINLGSGQAVIQGTADLDFGVAIGVENVGVTVPEPATLALLGLGLAGLGWSRRKA